MANLYSYSSNNIYSGYFDSDKCYTYALGSTLDNSWFNPVSAASARRCSGARQWSGNFLNWAATPTIDPFRSALTGGARVRDEVGLTVLQKARHSGQSSAGNRLNSDQGLLPQSEIAGATPFAANWGSFYVRLEDQGFDMLFSNWNDRIGGGGSADYGAGNNMSSVWVNLDPNNSSQWNGDQLRADYTTSNARNATRYSVYRVRVQVKVCDPSIGLESNCKRYSTSNYKPEGLLQQYSDKLRYSVFSYLNDSSATRDGGVLRANQSFIGPLKPDLSSNSTRAEWDPQTGILVRNPSSGEASATGNGVVDSGVINYLNKFGSMPYAPNSYLKLKSNDPVSELYYTALRYFKNQGNIPAYSNLSGSSDTDRYAQADGFPVVTNWRDPITYSCQKNVILGIGDTNTWNDKNLPGGVTSSGGEPATPPQVSSDTSVNVETATQKVASLEDIPISTPFTGRGNSAYIAGLAYDAHTRDQRSDKAGSQTISTYWMDVREDQTLAGRRSNQYWLAAKYGGFTVPNQFSSSSATSAAIADDMWWTNGETLSTGDKRPDNFFVASDAPNMIKGLKAAFAKIAQESTNSTASLGTNGQQFDTGSGVFQSLFEPKFWSGDLVAKNLTTTGFSASNLWSAATKLDAAQASSRKIFTSNTLVAQSGNTYSLATAQGVDFLWASLDEAGKAALQRTSTDSVSVGATEGERRLNYLRGERSQESVSSNPLRKRKSRLGDIVNSDPLYIGKPDYGYNRLTGSVWGTAGDAYLTYRQSAAYQGRKALVIVGANDGMLHGFDAGLGEGGGTELFAYVPRMLMGELYRLADPNYVHRYYVDGPPGAGDAWINGSWKSLVVGTAGAGGNTVFALDVSDPSNMGASKVLWEFSAPDMRYPIQQPTLVPLENGKFGVIVSSGFSDSTVSQGTIWILDAANGSVIKTFTLSTTGGLGEPLAIDTNSDRVADRLYVGDTVGNIWRFDLRGTDPVNWDAPANLKNSQGILPLFTARAGNSTSNPVQPITAPLKAALNSDGNTIVLFGTGSYYQIGDNEVPATPRMETYYGLIDKGRQINRSDLVEQAIIAQQTVANNRRARAVTSINVPTEKSGWYIDLVWKSANGGAGTLTSERVVSRSLLKNGVLIFNTITPNTDPCSGGGTSWTMTLDVLTGGALKFTFFDYNGDGRLDAGDYKTLSDGTKVPFSGILNDESGMTKTPAILSGGDLSSGQQGQRLRVCYSTASGSATCDDAQNLMGGSKRLNWREIR
ncbi:PilC/PilY family type IV pilus protein [Pseudomonas oryzihabitans]|uniref:pilus assembly protein n=1 Tax=Pseudomonas oryzihabitans TaxID=47885 RepID=UPI0028946E08|nr:PilC/PilY family type IV pilus protein [Pseudomonas oryzihabitans]MDT3718952.1 PilC/PilY family type IV pilus protein [Pseudomonas oryzihabitans]